MQISLIAAALLFCIGLAGVVMHRNLLRILLALSLMENATYLFLLTVGYREGATAPIFLDIPVGTPVMDPIMQALALTSIVIGVVTFSLGLVLIIGIVRHYRTLNSHKIRRLRG